MRHAGDAVRIGLVGAGFIGRMRAQALARARGAQLVAVADAREDAARAAAAYGRGVRVHADARALLEAADVDAVVLSTPPSSHEALGLAALCAGKHLLCEKPLATSVPACEALVAAAEQRGLALATGFNLRYTRAAQLARRLFDEGAIAALDHVRAVHGHSGGKEFGHAWVHDPAVSGGGTLTDNGIHVIDLARWFLGEVVSAVGCATGRVWRQEGCEDNGFLLLRSAQGCLGMVQASWAEWQGYGYRVEVYGTEGYLCFGYPPLYLVHGRRRTGGRAARRWHVFPAYQVQERLRGWKWGLLETLVAELEGWVNAVTSGAPPPVTGRDGLEAVRIALSAERIG